MNCIGIVLFSSILKRRQTFRYNESLLMCFVTKPVNKYLVIIIPTIYSILESYRNYKVYY